jgi:hypothetical protein
MKKGFYLLVAKSPGHLVDRVMPTGDPTFRMHQQLALCSARACRCNNPERKFIFEGKEWCPEPESNQRHADFQSAALPTELSGRALMWREACPVRRKPGPYRSSFDPCPAPRQSFFTTWENTCRKTARHFPNPTENQDFQLLKDCCRPRDTAARFCNMLHVG